MSEASAARAAAMADTAVSPMAPSAGTLLRQAREAAGLHIGALSVSLKVPVKKLEALEADRLELLPDAVFARALASSVCRTLKIDPAPVLSRLPDQVMPRLQLESSTTDRASLHPPRALWRAPGLARLPRPVVVVAGLLLMGAVALFFLPSLTSVPAPGGADAPASVEASPPAAASPVPAAALVNPVPAGAGAPAALPALGSTPTTMAALSTPAASLPAPAPVPIANVAALVLFKAKGASWVEVTDASGTTQLRKILNPGEAVPVAGVLPLAVVVGRADAVDVQVRGQPFDLAALARDNVARFQVK